MSSMATNSLKFSVETFAGVLTGNTTFPCKLSTLSSNGQWTVLQLGNHLLGFRMETSTSTGKSGLVQKWKMPLWQDIVSHHFLPDMYPWTITDVLGPTRELIIFRSPIGIQFYEPTLVTGGNFELTQIGRTDGRFHDTYGWTSPHQVLLWGQIYSPNSSNPGGLMVRKSDGRVQFYVMSSQALLKNERSSLWNLRKDVSSVTSDEAWSSHETQFYLTHDRTTGQDIFVLRTKDGLQLYQFGADYSLELIQFSLVLPLTNGKDKLIFTNLKNGGKFQEIIHMDDSSSTLNTYTFDDGQDDYIQVSSTGNIFGRQGSRALNGLVQMADLNGDGRDDMIFNGPRGLQVMTFDWEAKEWVTLLDPGQVPTTQRYSTVMAVVPRPGNRFTILVRDTQEKLQWGSLERIVVTTPAPTTIATTPRRIVITQQPKIVTTPKRIPPTQTTTTSRRIAPTQVTTTTTTWTTTSPDTRNREYNSLVQELFKQNGVVSDWKEKRMLRWSEQWEDTKFLSEAVDTRTGYIRFTLPLLTTQTDFEGEQGRHFQLSMSYESNEGSRRPFATTFLGVGWQFSLEQSFIRIVDDGSIFPWDRSYYLVFGGRHHKLEPPAATQSSMIFKLTSMTSSTPITLTYNPLQELWTLDQEHELISFGGLGNSDSLVYSLASPLGHTAGLSSTLSPVPISWYIKKRQSKYDDSKYIQYTYEKDTKSIPGHPNKIYTTSIRLVKITYQHKNPAMNTNVELIYSVKTQQELNYEKKNLATDQSDLKFPVTLTSPYYLQDLKLSTPSHRQHLRLIYNLKGPQRLPAELQENIDPESSKFTPIFRFDYKTFGTKPILCKTEYIPTALTFEYDLIERPSPNRSVNPRGGVTTHNLQSRPQIYHGPDYTILISMEGVDSEYLTLQPLTPDGLRVVENSQVSTRTLTGWPTIDRKEPITSYSVWPREGHVLVFLGTPGWKHLCAIYRLSSGQWSKVPHCHSFQKDSQIRIGPTWTVILEPKARGQPSNLTMVEWDPKEMKQIKTSLVTSAQSPDVLVAMDKRVVATYVENKLRLFSKKENTPWTQKTIDSPQSWFSSTKDTLDKFDLTQEFKLTLLTAFSEMALQLINNWVILGGLAENNGSITFRLYMVLLNKELGVARTQTMTFDLVTIRSVTKVIDNEGTLIHLIYKYEGGNYRVKVKDITGKYLKDLEKAISNRNLRADAREKELKTMNESSKFREDTQKFLLFDWHSLVPIRIISDTSFMVGNHSLVRMTEDGWVKANPGNTSGDKGQIKLGQQFLLEKDTNLENQYRLYKQGDGGTKIGSELRSFRVARVSGQPLIVNRFPGYLAYQDEQGTTNVVGFKDGGEVLDKFTKFPQEELSLQSGFQSLMTFVNTSASGEVRSSVHKYECKVRSTGDLLNIPNEVIASRMVLSGKVTTGQSQVHRVVGYERSIQDGERNSGSIETVRVVPGGQKNVYGWEEHSWRIMWNGTSTEGKKKIFGSNGQEIRCRGQKEDNEVNGKDVNQSEPAVRPVYKGVLYDRSGGKIVTDFTPYDLKRDPVGYIGFEEYEIDPNKPSKNGERFPWTFNTTHVRRDQWAFTGRSFLHLASSSTDYFKGRVRLSEDLHTGKRFLTSGWIRLGINGPLTLDEAVPYVVGKVRGDQGFSIDLFGVPRRQEGDWYYVELQLDYSQLKAVYTKYLESKGRAGNSNPVNFDIQIEVKCSPGDSATFVQVDHIRLSPIDHDFQATVFGLGGLEVATIQSNGLVVRQIRNWVGQKIADVNEDGVVSEFTRTFTPIASEGGERGTPNPSKITMTPENGFHEQFDGFGLTNRWEIIDLSGNGDSWKFKPSGFSYNNSRGVTGRLKSVESIMDKNSGAIRLYYSLESTQSSITFQWQNTRKIVSIQREHRSTADLNFGFGPGNPGNLSVPSVQRSGELILLWESHRIFIWLDGKLILDQRDVPSVTTNPDSSKFSIEVKGQISIRDVFILNRPQVLLEYQNGMKEPTQLIELQDDLTVLVSETLYDDLGRPVLKTKKTRIQKNSGTASLLSYHTDFVSKGKDLSSTLTPQGQIRGQASTLNPEDEGFPFTLTNFESNPLNLKSALGSPGKSFSVNGTHVIRYSRDGGVDFLTNLFPPTDGFIQEVTSQPNGAKKVNVYDGQENLVARYIRVPGLDHQLSTMEYDEDNNLVQILPPLYHERATTYYRHEPWSTLTSQSSPEDRRLRRQFGTQFQWTGGRLTRKRTPDTGEFRYLYGSGGLLRFTISMSLPLGGVNGTYIEPQSVVYHDYDRHGQLTSTGILHPPLPSLENLSTYASECQFECEIPPNHAYSESQGFYYSHGHPDPGLRGRVKNFVTHNPGGTSIMEELNFHEQDQVVLKKTQLTGKSLCGVRRIQTEMKKEYTPKGHLRTLTYPIQMGDDEDSASFLLNYNYNHQGHLVSLTLPGEGTTQNVELARFTYSATGHVSSEQYFPNTGHTFIRHFDYNSPGFLKRISDPFLTQTLDYTEGGYGQAGYGDGMVMRVTFNATWSSSADPEAFLVTETDLEKARIPPVCLTALKRSNIVSLSGRVLREIVPLRDSTAMPKICQGNTGLRLAQLLSTRRRPTVYGHTLSYGNHQELIRAKYFTDDSSPIGPLQPQTFSRAITGLSMNDTMQIWNGLTKEDFVIPDLRTDDSSMVVGKRGLTIINPTFRSDMLALNRNNEGYIEYISLLERFLLNSIISQKQIRFEDLQQNFIQWSGYEDPSISPELFRNMVRGMAQRVWGMLSDKGYLKTILQKGSPLNPTDYKILNNNFKTGLAPYFRLFPDIIRIIQHHFGHELGESAFDMDSHEIDPNGNHRSFCSGFTCYKLDYEEGTNKIERVTLHGPSIRPGQQTNKFRMTHDDQGNVLSAPHKGIVSIQYNPTTQRTTQIKMEGGSALTFEYDGQGERILKQVWGSQGKVQSETQYIRDESGRVLVDQTTHFLNEASQNVQFDEEADCERTTVVTTIYIYGPRGLIGFIRDGLFYSVMTDHAGSVRLVIRDGVVLAAYDYYPYGEMMRVYEVDDNASSRFRFTGQEWDKETGLLNFHARLYDPSIGRFYQVDPKAQYFSSYKYAGNSPLSLVDPDGEEAILILSILLGLAGAYFAGAAANNRWNPLVWDFSDVGTWTGIIGGGLAGGFLPLGFSASFSALGCMVGCTTAVGATTLTYTVAATTFGIVGTTSLGLGGAYLMAGAANKNWDPTKWEWTRPHTFSALFQGFSAGVSFVGGAKVVHNFAATRYGIGTAEYAKFLRWSYGIGGGSAYTAAVIHNNGSIFVWDWDWSNPTTLNTLLSTFDGAMGWRHGFAEMGKGLGKIATQPGRLKMTFSNLQEFKTIFGNSKHPLYKFATGVAGAYFMGVAANNQWDITRWNLASLSTYEGVLNGAFFGKDITGMLRGRKAQLDQLAAPIGVDTAPHSTRTLTRTREPFEGGFEQRYTTGYDQTFYKIISDFLLSKVLNLDKIIPQVVAQGANGLVRQTREFFRQGMDGWKSGRSKVPDDLVPLVADAAVKRVKIGSRKMRKWDEEMSTKRSEADQIHTDKDIPYLSCSAGGRITRRRRSQGIWNNGTRRVKRGVTNGKICRVTPPGKTSEEQVKEYFAQVKEEMKIVPQFMKDMSAYVKGTGISTHSIGMRPVQMINGQKQMFSLLPTDGGTGVHLIPKERGTYGFEGYWMNTRERIKIDPFDPAAKIVFTNELQGCSVYYRFDEGTQLLEMYHYNRPTPPGTVYLNNGPLSGLQLRNRGTFVDRSGKTVFEAEGLTQLLDSNGNPLKIDNGRILIDQQPYYHDTQKGVLTRLDAVGDVPINRVLTETKAITENEANLHREFGGQVIRHEDYFKFPDYYPLEMEAKIRPKDFATPIIYRDGTGQWIFQWQILRYPDVVFTSPANAKIFREQFTLVRTGRIPLVGIPLAKPGSSGVRSGSRQRRALSNSSDEIMAVSGVTSGASRVHDVIGWAIKNGLGVLTDMSWVRLSMTSLHLPTLDFVPLLEKGFWEEPPLMMNDHIPRGHSVRLSNELCVPWAILDRKYTDGLTCTSPSGSFTTTVFPLSPNLALMSGSESSHSISGDVYRDCRPIEWNGQASITCSGVKTNMIYTPQLRGRLFDPLDGWLLLAQVAPTAYRSVKSCFNWMLGMVTKTHDHEISDEETTHVELTQGLLSEWETSLDKIKKLITILSPSIGHQKLEWADVLWKEREWEFVQLSRSLGSIKKSREEKIMMDLMGERLDALLEDLVEFAEDMEQSHEMETGQKLGRGLGGCDDESCLDKSSAMNLTNWNMRANSVGWSSSCDSRVTCLQNLTV